MQPMARRLAVIATVMLLVGFCAACREPAVRTHAFSHTIQNYDPEMTTIQVSPVETTCVAKSYALLMATVRNAKGEAMTGKRVEWIVASEEGGVGDIVQVDESGLFLADRGNKWNNIFAETYTNQFDHDFSKAKGGGPDIEALFGETGHKPKILKGQTWIIVTSPIGGVTRITAYAPGIRDIDRQRAYATINWVDARAEFPEATAVYKAGQPYRLRCLVKRISDGEPLTGYPVRWGVEPGGTGARFAAAKKASVVVPTDKLGVAEVVLEQPKPEIGRNTIEVAALFPKGGKTAREALWTGRIGSVTVRREWCLPILSMKMTGPGKVHESDAAEYQIVVNNSGKVSAEEAVVTMVLPAGMSFLSAHPGGQVRGREIRWDLATLDPASKKEIAVSLKMDKEGEGVLRAGLRCKEKVSVDSDLNVRIVKPHLTISKTGPATVLRGKVATYKVVVKNTGTAEAMNVVVTEDVPPGFKANEETREAVWRIGTLGPGKSAEHEYAYVAEREGKCTHRSVVTADRGIKEEAKVVTIVTAPQLALTVSGPDKRYVNQKLAYQVMATNTGTAEASHVVITNKIATGFRFLEAGTNGEYDQASETVTWTLLGIPAGERSTVTVTVRAEQIGKFVNEASATADDGLYAKAEAVTSVEGIAALKLEMYDLYDPVEIGDQAEYTVNITNQGTGDATGLVLSGSFPREMEFVSGEGPTNVDKRKGGFTCGALATLQPGTKATYRIVLKANVPKDARFEISLTAKELSEPVTEQESTRIVE